jgi:hypothetical protein
MVWGLSEYTLKGKELYENESELRHTQYYDCAVITETQSQEKDPMTTLYTDFY